MELIKVNSLEEMGLSSLALEDFIKDYKKLGFASVSLIRDGKRFTLNSKPYREDEPFVLFSLSKSFTSMAAGFAVAEGKLHWDSRVTDVLSDCLPEEYDRKLDEVTLHHLLSMSSGLDPKSDGPELRMSGNIARGILSHSLIRAPGTVFHYNTMGTYLAGRMVQKAVGETLRDYLMPRVFDKIGVPRRRWNSCPMGYNMAGFGFHLSNLDIAKTAQLLLNEGMEGGERVLPEGYLQRASQPHISNGDPATGNDWNQGYGYQFWRSRFGRYRGDGMFGQVMMIDTRHNLAVAATASAPDMEGEMTALHALMDTALTLPPADKKRRADILKKAGNLARRMPADDGGRVMPLDGSYADESGAALRLDVTDENHIRMFYLGAGEEFAACFDLGRKKPRRGEVSSPMPGEGNLPYLGGFGMRGDAIRVRVLFPTAPFALDMKLSASADGLTGKAESQGFYQGKLNLKKQAL